MTDLQDVAFTIVFYFLKPYLVAQLSFLIALGTMNRDIFPNTICTILNTAHPYVSVSIFLYAFLLTWPSSKKLRNLLFLPHCMILNSGNDSGIAYIS